jgi:CPA1 family monovalent cation:H+ antiporter
MTWAGVRGPLSIALALSLHQRMAVLHPGATHVILVMTYAVVIFSVAVQGLTLRPLARRLARGRPAAEPGFLTES